jgi:phosphoenolpyruvate---glycerone phosphotransferase subunit DhaL
VADTEATGIDVTTCVDWLARFRAAVDEQKAYLTELDSAIGDADHGTNMARGMGAVMAKLDGTPLTSAEALFKGVGMTLVSSVGGASGPLYGTFFLRLATAAGDAAVLDGPALAAALRAALDGVEARGRAQPGDKTMLDAMVPALDALDAAVSAGTPLGAAAASAAEAAEAGRDATAPMLARKGRASYLGERSIGHLDPGSASTALLFRALADALADAVA